jgi:hypothetical protein
MCVVALRLAIAMACLASLKRRSRPHALAPEHEPNVAASAQECELRLSDRDTGPISWGIFRPVILLPKSAISWPRERLHAVLLQELAHIRRRDSFVQALSHAACAFYWPNPLVWLAAKKLRSEAELAADDAAISAGLKPSDYAGELLRLAHEFRAQNSALTSVAFFMASPSALEERVESVLSPNQIRSGVTTMDVLKITSVGLVAAAAIAFACTGIPARSTGGRRRAAGAARCRCRTASARRERFAASAARVARGHAPDSCGTCRPGRDRSACCTGCRCGKQRDRPSCLGERARFRIAEPGGKEENPHRNRESAARSPRGDGEGETPDRESHGRDARE